MDVLLVARGLAASREKAQRVIRAGKVLVSDRVVDLPATKVLTDIEIRTKGEPEPFVSRGGLKLASTLDYFNVEVDGKLAIDVGASTGGFTDCLLTRGAEKVYAVDVGYNQLDWRLRNDQRVVVLEKTNARYLTPEIIPEPPALAVMDVSFISITLILPALKTILTPNAEVVSLVKPQFEAGRQQVGKGGIIRDTAVHRQVLEKITGFCDETAWQIKDLTVSPIKGAKGNKEFFIHLENSNETNDMEVIKNRIEELLDD